MIIYVVLILLLMLPGLKPCLQMGNRTISPKKTLMLFGEYSSS